MSGSTKLIAFDFAIKYLLKNKSNYDIIEGFISALLKEHGYKPVKIVALLDTESNKEDISLKKSLADLIVEDEEHNKYIIEIERQQNKNFIHKSCFNTSRLIVDQLNVGDDYLGIKKVFHISLLYFKIGTGSVYHGKTLIRDIETKEKLNVHLEDQESNKSYDAVDILPEYIFISIPQFDDIIKSECDEWLYIMKHEEVKPEFKSPYMEKLAERLSVLKMSPDERNEYINYVKEAATISNGFTIARQEGEAKGRQEGIIIGEARGIEKGIEKEKIAIALNMLKQQLDDSVISSVTGLSIDEILKLKSQL